jgi:hypothetical protein
VELMGGLFLIAFAGLTFTNSSASPPPGWQIGCEMAWTRPYDPIVVPGGFSHQHDIFGARITPQTTYEDLRAMPNTCNRFREGGLSGDKSAYWVPSLYDRHGNKVRPELAVAYYRVAPGVGPQRIEPFPTGLKIVAGDHMARGPQPGVVVWACGGGGHGAIAHGHLPRDCTIDDYPHVIMSVAFPDCSDGRVDSPDHKSHMAYSVGGVCPPTHPHYVPRLSVEVKYALRKGAGATLSSNPRDAYGMHADFFSGWTDERLAELIRERMN